MAKKPKRTEVRIAPTPAPVATVPAAPKPPAKAERRVAAPTPKVDLNTTPPATSAPAKLERRVKKVAPAPATPKASRPTAVGKSKGTLSRYMATLDLLDENGPEISEVLFDLVRPCFASLDDGDRTLELAIALRGISQQISGTMDPALDGERITIHEGELAVVYRHADGGLTIYNIDTAEPVEMVMDKRAAARYKFAFVPATPAEFDRFIVDHARSLERDGAMVNWATPQK